MFTTECWQTYLKGLPALLMVTVTMSPTSKSFPSFAYLLLMQWTSNLITVVDFYQFHLINQVINTQILPMISNILIFSIAKEAQVSYLLGGFWFPACPSSSCFSPASKASLEQCLSCLGKKGRVCVKFSHEILTVFWSSMRKKICTCKWVMKENLCRWKGSHPSHKHCPG